MEQRKPVCQREQLRAKREAILDARTREREQKLAAQQKQQRQEQALAKMSDAQKHIHHLKLEFERQKRFRSVDPQGHIRELGSQLNNVIDHVVKSGSEEDKTQLYQLACELCHYWQVNLKKNKKMKQKLSVLK